MPISLNGTDIANRIRRFTKAVGAISNLMVDPIGGIIALADVTRDPYQSEFNSFASPQTQTAGIGNDPFIGIIGLAPVTLVDMVTFSTSVAAHTITLQTQRATTLSPGNAPTAATLAPFNGGGQGRALTSVCQARLINGHAAAAPSGQSVDLFLPAVSTVVTWIPPWPVVLYGPPFNGQAPGSGVGDAFVVTDITGNATLDCTIYFREFPNFTPQ